MIDPLRLADNLTAMADDYGTKATSAVSPDVRTMYGTASLILYALSSALLKSMQPILHDQAQKEHDDAA